MIENSFIHIPGVGKKTEEYLWKQGIQTWDDFLKSQNFRSLSKNRGKIIKDYIHKSKEALISNDISFFYNFLPQQEFWRLYPKFLNDTVFLDIETTGLSKYYDDITLIGTLHNSNYKIFIREHNLNDIQEYLTNFKIIVTFNGKMFDVPFLKKQFEHINIPKIHLDLRYLLRTIGLKGPLKKIEKKVGISRSERIKDFSGREAVILWNRFLRGNHGLLKDLILYNISDVVNLKYLFELLYKTKIKNYNASVGKTLQNTLFSDSKIGSKNFMLLHSNPFQNNLPKEWTVDVKESASKLNIFINGEKCISIDPEKISRCYIDLDDAISTIKEKEKRPISVGIDLTGSEKRLTGFCVLNGKNVHTELLSTDEEIIARTLESNPQIISIDSPLSLPEGRDCTNDDCECRRFGITRFCERTLKKRGINVYPCLIDSMKGLTLRGIKLSNIFKEKGFDVIESYPGAAQDIMQISRKKIDLKELEIGLKELGLSGNLFNKEKIVHDELDALTSALVGLFYMADSFEPIGNIKEGFLIIPKFKKTNMLRDVVETCQ